LKTFFKQGRERRRERERGERERERYREREKERERVRGKEIIDKSTNEVKRDDYIL
jgi:hypothetical protein